MFSPNCQQAWSVFYKQRRPRVKKYMQGWLGCFGIASMKTTMERLAPAEAVNGYLEAVEKAGDMGQEFETAGNSPGRGVSVGKYPQGLLARDG